MVYTTSLFNLPLLILIWLIETYLFLACARLVVSGLPGASRSQFCEQLRLLTDFLPEVVGRWLPKSRGVLSPNWLAWCIVLVSGFILRQVLVLLIAG